MCCHCTKQRPHAAAREKSHRILGIVQLVPAKKYTHFLSLMTKMIKRRMLGVLLRWSECTNKHVKLQQKANSVVMRIRRKTMLTAFHTYSANVEDEKAIAFKTLRAVTCWANRCLHGCLRG